jgi:hypothetical protein
VNDLLSRIPRTAAVSVAAGLVVGLLVLTAGLLRGEAYQGRVSLLAEPAGQADGSAAQYGEVVSLALPALVELARSPSVLQAAAPVSGYAPEELGTHVSVELVPASGLARLSVRAPSAEQAGATASALGKAMIDANLLAPAGRLRALDPRPDVVPVAPDAPLVTGLALAAAGIHRPVAVLRADDPAAADRLAVLGRAAGRPVRVVPVAPELAETAAKLAAALPDEHDGTGTSVVAVTGKRHHDELTATAGVLPADAVLVAVVLA